MSHAVVARIERSEIRDAFTSKEQRLRPIEELRARLEGENDDNAVRSLNEWIRVLGH
jgi:hypothetical protein